MTRTKPRSVLITGCSSGIGLDCAATLKAKGWRVFASCRAQEDCARLEKDGFESPRIDYEDPDSVASGLQEVLDATGGTLDALVNNGAYAIPGALEDIKPDAMQAIFEANFLGWHRLTRAVVPVMRAQGHGRIIQVSSVLGFAAMPWRGAYNSTKFALEGYSDTLRLELAPSGLHVVLIEPGPITSEFRKNSARAFERWVQWRGSALADLYETKLIPRLKDAEAQDGYQLPSSAVTAKILYALTSPRPRPRYYVTAPTHVIGALKRVMSTRMLDRVLSRL